MQPRRALQSLFIVTVALQMVVGVSRADEEEQTTAQQVKLLRTPASPAFVLLGVEPSSVERPSTPRALGVSLASAVRDSNLIPSKYALEVSPYWLLHHARVSYEDLYKNAWQTLQQTTAMSIATSRTGAHGDSVVKGSSVAIAIRGSLAMGKWKKEVQDKLAEIHTVHLAMLRADEGSSAYKELEVKRKALALKLSRLQVEREGFALEWSAGMVEDFADDVAENGKIGKYGAWLTPTYKSGNLMLLAVARLMRDQRGVIRKTQTDVGGRVLWESGRFDASVEIVTRHTSDLATGSGNTSRRAGILEYRLDDSVYLSGTFGSDYGSSSHSHPLIAALGLNWAIGSSKVGPSE